jgi:hypothetical protein
MAYDLAIRARSDEAHIIGRLSRLKAILRLDLVRWKSSEDCSDKAMSGAKGIDDGGIVIEQGTTDDNWDVALDEELPCDRLEHYPVSENDEGNKLLAVLKVQDIAGDGVDLRLDLSRREVVGEDRK